MESKQENSKVMSCIETELNNGTENPVVIETVVLESDISESGSNVGEGGGGGGAAAAAGSRSIGASCSSCVFRPPPPFLLKIYDMVENSETNAVISWNSTGTSFIVWNAHSFAANILPQYFRHNNFQSFICQLNTYGFKKISWDQWEFKNECFRKGKMHLLKYIKRRNQYPQSMKKPVRTEPNVDTSSRRTEKELQILTNDQDELKVEIMKLKEQQGAVEKELASVKNGALNNALENQKRVMFTAQKFLSQLRELCSNGVENVIKETQETKRIPGQDTADILKLNSEQFAPQQKLIMDDLASIRAVEEQMTEFQPNTLIPLEDLVGRSGDWVEYLRELQESNSS